MYKLAQLRTGDDSTIPDRAEAEHAIKMIAGLFA